MKTNKCILLCQSCGWKSIQDNNKIEVQELGNDTLSNKKYRCPQCGRGVTSRKFPDPQRELNLKLKKEKIKDELSEFIDKNLNFQKDFLKEVSE